MQKFFKLILLLFLPFFFSFAQQEGEMITVIGDSLVGKVVGGESIREVIGNVILKQGNVVVTCSKAIQFLAKNEAEIIGNVVVTQDSLTLKTDRGFYYGSLRKTKSTSGIILDDTKVILSADSGEYYFDEHRAFFQTNVTLQDSATTMTANELTYFKNQDRSVAVGNVNVWDEKNIINADTLVHYRNDKTSIADGNVSIHSYEDNMTIFGDHLEDYGAKKYTVVNENPVLMQVDTTTSVDTNSVVSYEIDTLLIKSKFMEGFRDTANFFKAFDSVKIIRRDFASVNDFTLYLRSSEKIITEKTSDTASRPILWYENSQLTGDSITIFLEDNEIKNLVVNENAFMLSQNKTYPLRFDQTSSKNIRLTFEGNDLQRAEFEEKVQSIYYLFEDEKPNGVSKSTGQNAAIIFADNEVSEVRLYGSPTSEYYPEVKVVGLERTFTLPKFVFNENRPLKKEFLSIINKKNGYNTP